MIIWQWFAQDPPAVVAVMLVFPHDAVAFGTEEMRLMRCPVKDLPAVVAYVLVLVEMCAAPGAEIPHIRDMNKGLY